jgi:hypothetical protein
MVSGAIDFIGEGRILWLLVGAVHPARINVVDAFCMTDIVRNVGQLSLFQRRAQKHKIVKQQV